ncbi:MAG: YfbU family protein [Chloroflexota bacterium]|nr:YfbU family protein [Chloroflexota bacterium]
MQLSQVERWILTNQYRIMEILDSTKARQYARARKVLESGYELEYDSISQHIDRHTLGAEACREVRNILSMFVALSSSYTALTDTSGIEEQDITFRGFDGNSETAQMGYTRFLVDQKQMFTDLPRGDSFNSHIPLLNTYRRMLREWEQSTYKYNLTKDDIIRITSSGNPKSNLRVIP